MPEHTKLAGSAKRAYAPPAITVIGTVEGSTGRYSNCPSYQSGGSDYTQGN